MQLDHIFIRVRPGAPEAAVLTAFGLCEGAGNRHPGQGTANRRFFFANAFLELLWLDDAAEAQSAATRPTLLFERLSGAGSPFGLCFRPAPGAAAPLPFASWRYQPDYLPPGVTCDIALAPLSEPMCFHLAPGGRPDALPPARAQPLAHRVPLRDITAVKVSQPRGLPSLALPVCFEAGDADLLELTFDGGAQGRSHDFRPALPLIFHY
ncbi:MAG: VOC family protein [Burkholderiaceae bacterium]|nr:VOC family protein [Burkholderiaceae bacterium]